MAKFPSQRKLLYETGLISDSNFVSIASGGVSGHLNLPKDLSILNRRGYASTTRKGVPLVYKCKIDFMLHDFAGAVAEDIEADGVGILRISGCQNNWVMRNAAVKMHAAREASLKHAGVTKAARGAYAHEIRYNYDGAGDTWLVPIDGDGAAFTGGTWDQTKLQFETDTQIQLKLVGDATTEDASLNISAQQLGYAYLASRGTVLDDSNVESFTRAEFSMIEQMLNPGFDTADDNIRDNARNEGDNPPYDEFDLEVANDITEPVELGRVIVGRGELQSSMIVEIPFGLAKLNAKVTNLDADQADTEGLFSVEVLDIFEMQG